MTTASPSRYRKAILVLLVGIVLAVCIAATAGGFLLLRSERVSTALLPPTPTATRSASEQIPTPTLVPTQVSEPESTPTQTTAARPEIGAFGNPAHIGDRLRIEMKDGVAPLEMYVELLDAASGEAASQLAAENLSYPGELLEGQEYVAVKVHIEIVRGLEGEDMVTALYGEFHMALRRSPEGTNIGATASGGPWAEGYLPLKGERWLFFKVRADTQYYLYASPYLAVTGDTTGGAYFTLLSE